MRRWLSRRTHWRGSSGSARSGHRPTSMSRCASRCSARGNAIIVEQRAPWNPELRAEWTTSRSCGTTLRRDMVAPLARQRRPLAFLRTTSSRPATSDVCSQRSTPTRPASSGVDPAALRRVDRGAIARFGNRLAGLARRCEPCPLGLLHLGEGLLGSRAKGRARLEVRDVGDVAAVLVAVEDVDVVVAQRGSSICKAYRSTRRRNWRTW